VRAEGETAVDLTRRAGETALQAAGMSPADVDLLIYVGVGRGFLEPATANIFQDQLGLRKATCFDVLDACASWLRAVHVARAFISSGEYENVMIINGEFNFRDYAEFRFEAIRDLSHNFAVFTIGEAATATIVCRTDEDAEYFATFRTWGALRNLCMIPLPNVDQFVGAPMPDHARTLRFFSYSKDLLDAGMEKLVSHFRQEPRIHEYRPDIAFGHAASDSASDRVARECGASPSSYYRTHARFGNTVSASVPLAMAYARKEGRLKNRDRVMIGMASAGLSTAWTRFRYMES
jgi:3-oxoacyl-[acyl-carrier-protein] synthase III